MRRRRFVKALFVAPAAPALLAQQTSQSPALPPSAELPKIDIAVADAASEPMPRFFTRQQFTALQKLSGILMPGAPDAQAAEFLDFLIGESPVERQHLYRAGLDAVNAAAKQRFNQAFADLDAAQADVILSPLREAWTYDPPADPLARFLRDAKQDIRTATVNSREYSAHAPEARGRRFGGNGLYWHSLD